MPTTRALTPADLPDAALMVARAFFDDPGWIWLFPDTATRLAKTAAVVQTLTEVVYLPHGVSSILDDRGAVAIWQPPGHVTPSPLSLPSIARRLLPVFGASVLGAARAGLRIESRRPKTPHHYLYTLAVDPERQGQGLGRVILEPGFARSRADGLPCWLESSNPRNHSFYRKVGFEPQGTLSLGGDASITFFRRPPG